MLHREFFLDYNVQAKVAYFSIKNRSIINLHTPIVLEYIQSLSDQEGHVEVSSVDTHADTAELQSDHKSCTENTGVTPAFVRQSDCHPFNNLAMNIPQENKLLFGYCKKTIAKQNIIRFLVISVKFDTCLLFTNNEWLYHVRESGFICLCMLSGSVVMKNPP